MFLIMTYMVFKCSIAFLNYEMRLLSRCTHHFEPDTINNMTISAFLVMNPHQSSLAKKVAQKFKSDAQKVPIQGKAKKGKI